MLVAHGYVTFDVQRKYTNFLLKIIQLIRFQIVPNILNDYETLAPTIQFSYRH